MRFRISRSTKQKLANKLGYHPFLRLLIFKFWFRLAALGLAVLLVFLALFLPKMWRVSEPGTLPIIKISGLDMVQAWSLKRTARREMAAGKYDRAHFAWLGAVGNNPTDPAALRGLLSNLVTSPPTEPNALHLGVVQSLWLLRLTHTNQTDLELVTTLLYKYEYHDLVISLLLPLADRLSANEQAALLKALLQQGNLVAFLARWKQFGADHLPDAELPLYWAAFTLGWGSVQEAEQARQKLKTALEDPNHRVLANRLLLFASAYLNDCLRYQESLTRLEGLYEDRVTDHTRYWGLLWSNRQTEEAKRLALAYAGRPRTTGENVALVKAYAAVGLNDQASQSFRTLVVKFPQVDEVWLAYVDFLAQIKDWEELGRVAIQIRTAERLQQRLAGYSYFIEGWSQCELNRRPNAETAFRKMNQLWVGNPRRVLEAGSRLMKLGYTQVARELLGRFEEEFKTNADYWHTQFAIGAELKDAGLLLKAAGAEYQLEPGNVQIANHYAAALLINRSQPELAARLTLKLMTEHPGSVGARINHGFALLLNHRTDEARTVLSQIRSSSLTPEVATPYHLALFHVDYELKQYQAAWQMRDRIDTNLLFLSDLAWLEECQKKMPPRVQAKL